MACGGQPAKPIPKTSLTFLLLTAFLKHTGHTPLATPPRIGPHLLQSRPYGFALKARVDNFFRSKPLDPVASAAIALVEELPEQTHQSAPCAAERFALDCHDAREGGSA